MQSILIHSVEALTILLVLLAIFRIYKHYSIFKVAANKPKPKVNIAVKNTIQEEKNPNAVLNDYIGNFF